jgi:CubicO group peptidase (beta-lactamase class C family)
LVFALEHDVAVAMETGISAGIIPGGVVCIIHAEETPKLWAWGHALRYDAPEHLASTPLPATTSTVYDLASLTKLFTATLVMQLVEQGQIALDQTVATYVPGFARGGKERVTIRQLLTHTSGLAAGMPLYELAGDKQVRLDAALGAPLTAPPNTAYCYSDLGFIALGVVVEHVTGQTLDLLVREKIAVPLGLRDTGYLSTLGTTERIAPTEFRRDAHHTLAWGVVHDENAHALGGVAGHAGLFGTASDVARFGACIVRGGKLDGTRLLRPETVAAMTSLQTPHVEQSWRGLGFHLNQQQFMGALSSPCTYGHTGFTGTSIVIDPRRSLVLVLLTNRVHPSRERTGINEVRQGVADAVAAALPPD